jgi:uncharacterized protein YraI
MFGGLLMIAGATAANAAVVSGDLNLRSGPGTGYRVIDTMPAGSYVDVLGCTGSWCRVQFGGAVGYASASYLGGGGDSYAAAPVYAEPPIYSEPYYAGPAFGFGVGFGSRYGYGWGGGWHHRWHGHRHHH